MDLEPGDAIEELRWCHPAHNTPDAHESTETGTTLLIMRSATVIAYLTPLREGGSLPGVVEASDLGTYVMKLRAAGQGPRVLATEVIVAHLARHIGLRVPELVTLELDAAIGRREPDPEIQQLLVASAGLNLGMDFLPGSLGFDPLAFTVDADEAARVLWLDAFTANVDRTHRNPNLLLWHGDLWCIDHGAALRFQYDWSRADEFPTARFDATDHVLAQQAGGMAGLAPELARHVDDATLATAVDLVPDAWLAPDPDRPDLAAPDDPAAARRRYVALLAARRDAMASWLPRSAG